VLSEVCAGWCVVATLAGGDVELVENRKRDESIVCTLCSFISPLHRVLQFLLLVFRAWVKSCSSCCGMRAGQGSNSAAWGPAEWCSLDRVCTCVCVWQVCVCVSSPSNGDILSRGLFLIQTRNLVQTQTRNFVLTQARNFGQKSLGRLHQNYLKRQVRGYLERPVHNYFKGPVWDYLERPVQNYSERPEQNYLWRLLGRQLVYEWLLKGAVVESDQCT